MTHDVEPTERVTHPNDESSESALAAGAWGKTLERLDRAKELDPQGDGAPEVQESRRRAQRMRDVGDAAGRH